MEAHMLQKDQSLSPSYKPQNQIKNPRNYNQHHPLISHPSENFGPLINSRGGLLYAPPPPQPPSHSYSFPPPVSAFPQQYYHQNRQQQPPLLPLPIPNLQNYNPSRARGLSCPPVNRKIKNRSQPTTPRKSKANAKSTGENPVVVVESKANRLGPEPPKNLPSRVLSSNNNNNSNKVVVVKQVVVDEFTDISPPPSSLPLPTFFLRPKLVSCNVEAAAGVDAGATNDLCRLLRLR